MIFFSLSRTQNILILFTASFFVQEIYLEDAEKENNVHHNDDGQG